MMPFIMLYKVVLVWVEDQIVKSVIVQLKAINQYLTVVLFIMLNKVVLIFECEDEVMMCDNSNES